MNSYTWRGFLFIAALAGAVFLLRAPALAIVEVCPAEVNVQAAGPAQASPKDAGSLYGLQLTAFSPRSISATLAFDTSAGWFVSAMPQTPLLPFRAKYVTNYSTFEKQEYRSRKMYVDFGKRVTINHVILANAVADDAQWKQRGPVTCLHSGRLLPRTRIQNMDGFRLLNNDVELSATPSPSDTVLRAVQSPPVISATCPQPFKEAISTIPVTPDYPMEMRGRRSRSETTVQLALDAGGNVIDAWIDRPSGVDAFDNAALRAAQSSKYEPAISYCTPVPSLYLFRVTFDPN